MKNSGLKIVALFLLMIGGTTVSGQTVEREVPGDDFSLEGALELFKKSASPEEFERMLNVENSKVNNLDLNGDGSIDYLRVIDRKDGNVHAFIIQAVVSNTENQDIAVIELEKLANGKAVLQITGDEDIYGIETIIEPTEEVYVNAGTSTARTTVNVWTWPSVQYVYDPYYTGWVSPWGWSTRPYGWYGWRPVAYYHYNSWWQPYRPYYTHCHMHRVGYAHEIYRQHRTTSGIVRRRHETQVASYRSSHRDNRTTTLDRNNDERTTNRNDYRADRSNNVRRSSPDTNADSKRSRPAFDTQNSRQRDTNRDTNSGWKTSDNRRTHTVTRSEDRTRSTVQQPRNDTPARRLNPTADRTGSSEQTRTRPTASPERSKPSGGNNKSQASPHGRSRRSK
jgi:hypothetical protein